MITRRRLAPPIKSTDDSDTTPDPLVTYVELQRTLSAIRGPRRQLRSHGSLPRVVSPPRKPHVIPLPADAGGADAEEGIRTCRQAREESSEFVPTLPVRGVALASRFGRSVGGSLQAVVFSPASSRRDSWKYLLVGIALGIGGMLMLRTGTCTEVRRTAAHALMPAPDAPSR